MNRALRGALVAAVAVAWAPAAYAQSAREAATVIMPENKEALAFQTEVGFADAVVTGDTIYLSGVVAAPAPGESGLAPAFDRAFGRIAAVLGRAGASWDDVVDMTTFHTDLPGSINEFAAVKNRYVKPPFPTWTAIGISKLYEPTAVVEIKVVAKKPTAR